MDRGAEHNHAPASSIEGQPNHFLEEAITSLSPSTSLETPPLSAFVSPARSKRRASTTIDSARHFKLACCDAPPSNSVHIEEAFPVLRLPVETLQHALSLLSFDDILSVKFTSKSIDRLTKASDDSQLFPANSHEEPAAAIVLFEDNRLKSNCLTGFDDSNFARTYHERICIDCSIRREGNAAERRAARRIQVLKAVKTHRKKKQKEPIEDESSTSPEEVQATRPTTPSCPDEGLEIAGYVEDKEFEIVSSNSLVTFGGEVAELRLPAPDNSIMRNATLLVSNLLEDFFNLAGQSEDWWPWYNASEYLYSDKIGARLLGYSNIANFASCIGKAGGDQALSSLGRSTYCDTIRRTNGPYHSIAGNRIIEQAGAEMFQRGLGVNVLVGHMSRMMMHNFGARRRSLLADEQWLNVLSSLEVQPYKHTIWQYAAQIPTLMEYLDSLLANENVLAPACLKALATLRTQALLLDIALDDWIMSFEGGEHVYWDKARLGTDHYLFGAPLEFATLASAEIMILSWNFKLELAIIALEVTRVLAMSTSCEADLSIDKYLAVKELATMLCRAAPYRNNVQASTPAIYYCLSFPHRIAWKWFASEEACAAEAEWCAKSSQDMGSRLLGRVAENLVDRLNGCVDTDELSQDYVKSSREQWPAHISRLA